MPPRSCMGSNLRLLQGTDRDQEGRRRVARSASRAARPAACCCATTARAASWSGTSCTCSPCAMAKGRLTHYVGFFRDASGRLRSRRSRHRGTAGLAARGSRHRPFIARLVRRAAGARVAHRAARVTAADPGAVRHRCAGSATTTPSARRPVTPASGASARTHRRRVPPRFATWWRAGTRACIVVLAVHRDGMLGGGRGRARPGHGAQGGRDARASSALARAEIRHGDGGPCHRVPAA